MWSCDGEPISACQFRSSAGMVDMGVRDPDLLKLYAAASDFGQNSIDITTGIDHNRFARLVTPE